MSQFQLSQGRNSPYSSNDMSHLRAFNLAGIAMNAASGEFRVHRCRALLQVLDPDHPPASVNGREFRWQYRALLERVRVYSERLERAQASSGLTDLRLQRTEAAIDLSLRYFRDVLTPDEDPEDDESGNGS
jgi:hypothetical protein